MLSIHIRLCKQVEMHKQNCAVEHRNWWLNLTKITNSCFVGPQYKLDFIFFETLFKGAVVGFHESWIWLVNPRTFAVCCSPYSTTIHSHHFSTMKKKGIHSIKKNEKTLWQGKMIKIKNKQIKKNIQNHGSWTLYKSYKLQY